MKYKVNGQWIFSHDLEALIQEEMLSICPDMKWMGWGGWARTSLGKKSIVNYYPIYHYVVIINYAVGVLGVMIVIITYVNDYNIWMLQHNT